MFGIGRAQNLSEKVPAGPVSMLDIAPTIAKLMDIQPHPEWEGDLISDIFVSSFCKVPMMRLG